MMTRMIQDLIERHEGGKTYYIRDFGRGDRKMVELSGKVPDLETVRQAYLDFISRPRPHGVMLTVDSIKFSDLGRAIYTTDYVAA